MSSNFIMDFNPKINENVDIFIYSHVPFVPVVENPVYKILTNSHAPTEEFNRYPFDVTTSGGTLCCRNLPVFRDYTGDNISEQNYFYIENTGTYWIWKNVRNVKYKGQCQYRRRLSGITETTDFDEIAEKCIFTSYKVNSLLSVGGEAKKKK